MLRTKVNLTYWKLYPTQSDTLSRYQHSRQLIIKAAVDEIYVFMVSVDFVVQWSFQTPTRVKKITLKRTQSPTKGLSNVCVWVKNCLTEWPIAPQGVVHERKPSHLPSHLWPLLLLTPQTQRVQIKRVNALDCNHVWLVLSYTCK